MRGDLVREEALLVVEHVHVAPGQHRVLLSVLVPPVNITGIFLDFFSMYSIQLWFICCPSDSAVSEDAGMEPRTVATSALAVRRSNH